MISRAPPKACNQRPSIHSDSEFSVPPYHASGFTTALASDPGFKPGCLWQYGVRAGPCGAATRPMAPKTGSTWDSARLWGFVEVWGERTEDMTRRASCLRHQEAKK